MKATLSSLQSEKLRFLETFMQINDAELIHKLHQLLLRETKKQSPAFLLTDEMIDELESRWQSYKEKKEPVYTFEQVKSAARATKKASHKK